MKALHKSILLTCFLFLLGCGETTVGESQPPTGAAATDQTPAETATDGRSSPADGGETLDSVASVTYVEGTHYQHLDNPVPTTVDDARIEVAEVFWYGCNHCYHFEPLISEWAANQPEDVAVVKSPAMWDRQGIMEKHARIYYTAKALGAEDTIDPAVFKALNVDGEQLRTDEAIAELFVDNGVDREAFERTFNSFGVTSAVRQAEARQRGYQVQGTPELVVDGTYRISATMAGSQEAMLKVADYLTAKIRDGN